MTNNLNVSTTQSEIRNVNLAYTTACNAVIHLCTLFDIFKAVNYLNITLQYTICHRHSNTTLIGQRIFKQNGEREADDHGFVVDVVRRTPIKINRGRTRILRGRKEKIQR